MARRPGAPFDERTEAEIRMWVRDRDAGPAPERLRMRIARVAESEPAPRWGFRAVLRPAYAPSPDSSRQPWRSISARRRRRAW